MTIKYLRLSRRQALLGASTSVLGLPFIGATAFGSEPLRLVAAPGMAGIALDKAPATPVWAYNGQVPGPSLRFRQGQRLAVDVENRLAEPTSVHWHGLRPPAFMDGVPFLSHDPIAPGDTFRYEFDLVDAGTFWYHPHFNSSEQVGRGLSGALIVDEAHPPEMDRDETWVLDDWSMQQDAQLAPFDPGDLHSASHGGRIGNVVTINGNIGKNFSVRAGERLRLRLINVANARNFALRFDEAQPWVIALDGHPIEPARLENNQIQLGSGQRADLIIDFLGEPGSTDMVTDIAYGQEYSFPLMRFAYSSEMPLRDVPMQPPSALLPNPVAEPDLAQAKRHRIVFEGGAMGGLQGAMLKGQFTSMSDLVKVGKLWAINGQVPDDFVKEPPLLDLRRNQSYILELENRTAFAHPIHLHGHSFRVISRNGKTIAEPAMRDTVLLQPNERQEIAFVADNPGKWMFHCHILEHQATAMTGVVAVS